MSIPNYSDPTIITWYTNENGQKVSVQRLNQTYKITNNKIVLSEIPDEFNKINTITIGATVLYEAKIGTVVTTTNFVVNYGLGEITVDSSHDAKTAAIPSWFARGNIKYPVSRIYTLLDEGGNIVETLGNIIEDGREAVTAYGGIVPAISDAEGLTVQLESDISTGNPLHTALQTDISTASEKKVALENVIATADTTTYATQGQLTSHLSDYAYTGAASRYGVNPTALDATEILNSYFDDLETSGIKYAFFDKPNRYLASNALFSAYKVLPIGNAEFEIPYMANMQHNYYYRICNPHRQFNGKINSCNNQNKSFKQFVKALSENRDINITIWGDSISVSNDIINTNQNASTGTEFTSNGITSGEGYVHNLIDMFTRQYPDKTFDFYDRSIGGENITGWNSNKIFNSVTKTWIEHIKDTAPDLLIIAFGMNSDYNVAKQTAYIIKQVMDYIEVNFGSFPDVVFITPPRPIYVISDVFGYFESQTAREVAAEAIRTNARNRGAYVVDVNRISNIKRMGTDLMHPRFKEITLQDAYFSGVTPSSGVYMLGAGNMLYLNLYAKNFVISFDVTFSNPADDSYIDFAYNFSSYNNLIRIIPDNEFSHGLIGSFATTADYVNWGLTTVNYEKSSPITSISLRIEKRDDIIEIFEGNTKLVRDLIKVWNAAGICAFNINTGASSTFSTAISNIKYYAETYTTYTPTLTENEMFGEYDENYSTTKQPYGGSGGNHPSSIGVQETYVPALEEMMSDLGACATGEEKAGMLQDTITFETIAFGETGASYQNVGLSEQYPYAEGILRDSSGNRYTQNYNVKSASDIGLLSANEFGAYMSAGNLQVFVPVAVSSGWKFTTYAKY